MAETKFSVTSYNGITVSCSKERWDTHIVLHEIMDRNVEAVKDTIKDPDIVYRSDQNDDREVFYKKSALSTYSMNTKVIVQYGQGKKNPDSIVGEVVTSFPTNKVKGGVSDVVYKKQSNN